MEIASLFESGLGNEHAVTSLTFVNKTVTEPIQIQENGHKPSFHGRKVGGAMAMFNLPYFPYPSHRVFAHHAKSQLHLFLFRIVAIVQMNFSTSMVFFIQFPAYTIVRTMF